MGVGAWGVIAHGISRLWLYRLVPVGVSQSNPITTKSSYTNGVKCSENDEALRYKAEA